MCAPPRCRTVWSNSSPGTGENADGSLSAGVEPMLVPESNQLAGVDDVFNAVLVRGDMLGDVVFYGKGAGKLPTASAVVADVIDALKEGSAVHNSLFWQPAEKLDHPLPDTRACTWQLRVLGAPHGFALPLVPVCSDGGETVCRVENATPAQIDDLSAEMKSRGCRLLLAIKQLDD